MGQVFTWDSLRLGLVPKLENFPEVVESTRKLLLGERSIHGAVVCGSVIRNDHSVRSDIDCFVLYDHQEEHRAFECMQRAVGLAASVHVPLGFIPCDTKLAATRMHHIGGSFLTHVRKSAEAGGLLKGDPLNEIVYSHSERDELESYLRVKMYNLQEAWSQVHTFSEERMATYLKKLFEAPLHIARKTIGCIEPLAGDSKAYVKARYMEIMPENMPTMLARLLEIDAGYTTALSENIQRPVESEYRELLLDMLNHSEDVLAFIRSNLAFVATAAR